jgi:hypothetical protein
MEALLATATAVKENQMLSTGIAIVRNDVRTGRPMRRSGWRASAELKQDYHFFGL